MSLHSHWRHHAFWVLQPEGRELEEEAGASLVVKCDAVVVGSGAGAGPCTALLAAAGLRVLVLEKGTFTPNHELSLTVLFAISFVFLGVCAHKHQLPARLPYFHDHHTSQGVLRYQSFESCPMLAKLEDECLKASLGSVVAAADSVLTG